MKIPKIDHVTCGAVTNTFGNTVIQFKLTRLCLQNAELEELSSEVSNLREISETAFSELKKNELQFTTSVKKLKTTEIQLLVLQLYFFQRFLYFDMTSLIWNVADF